MVSSNDVTITEVPGGSLVVQRSCFPAIDIWAAEAAALRAHFAAERMPEDVQKLVNEAAERRFPGNPDGPANGVTLALREAFSEGYRAALEAAQRPQFDALCVLCGAPGEFLKSPSGSWWAHNSGHHPEDDHDFQPAAQRPPVSLDVREALEWAGIKALVESAEVPTGVRALLLGEVFTIREAVDAEIVVRVVLDAALARLSVPSQPVYDEEAIARLLAMVDDYDGCFERIDEWEALPDWEKQAHPDEEPMSDREDAEWWLRRARALVTALRGGELTREETNE